MNKYGREKGHNPNDSRLERSLCGGLIRWGCFIRDWPTFALTCA
jgi:hypothetical protein